MDLEHEKRLTEVESRSKSNTKRIDRLETQTEAINKLATSMAVMAERQEECINSVSTLDVKVTALEAKPAKRWESIVEKAILAVVAAVIAYLLAKVGL